VRPMPNPKVGIYRHFKGQEYEVLGVAKHSETMDGLVVYRALYGDGELWVRPVEMFSDRISKDGASIPRFQFIRDSDP